MSGTAAKKVMRDVFLAFARVHVLHHAARESIFGLEMMNELKRHGYELGPGTLYPLLHALESSGVLVASDKVVGGKVRRYYRATRAGEAMLREVRAKLDELVDEVCEDDSPGARRGRQPGRATKERRS